MICVYDLVSTPGSATTEESYSAVPSRGASHQCERPPNRSTRVIRVIRVIRDYYQREYHVKQWLPEGYHTCGNLIRSIRLIRVTQRVIQRAIQRLKQAMRVIGPSRWRSGSPGRPAHSI